MIMLLQEHRFKRGHMINLIRFVIVILTVMFTTHYFLYFSWTRFFSIQSGPARNIVSASLVFLSFTFIASSLLVHWSSNVITRTYYIFSGLWMGLLTFLVMATIIVWFLKALLIVMPGQVPVNMVVRKAAFFLYALAVCYTAFCCFQAGRIQIRSIQVPMANLPAAWEDRTIIQLSDLHIGSARGPAFLEKIVEMCNRQQPDLVVITGDLFDGAVSAPREIMPLFDKMEAPLGILFTSGNHEVYSGISQIRKLVESSSVTLLDDRAVVIDGLQFLGIAYPDFNQKKLFDFSDQARFNRNLPTVLLNHTPTGIKNFQTRSQPSYDYLAPDTEFSYTISQGIKLQLSGHTHAGQFFPYTWLAARIFKGYHFGLHRKNDFYINISAGTGTWGPLLRSVYLSEIVVIKLFRAND